jgi:transposase
MIDVFARFRAPQITLSDAQRTILETLHRGTHVAQHLQQRATIILLAADGQANAAIARCTGWARHTVKQWRGRWVDAAPVLAETEVSHRRQLRAAIEATLNDAPRSGNPGKITNLQLACIIEMACEPPTKYDVPFSHWTAAALAHTAIQRKIVPSISARQVGRYLAHADLKPHRSKYWLNPKVDDPEAFKAQVKALCQLYAEAPQLAEAGTQVHSTDEMTGIKAHEHTHAPQPMRPGAPEAIEFEYERHGTSGMIVSRNVVTGTVEAPLIQPTRTEADFLQHIRNVVALAPKAQHIFIADNLNTHQSESLVRYVIEQEKLPISDDVLGQKEKSGILKSQATRKAFLENPDHAIRFMYTPKHCSWLNQIECWLSIPVRRLLNKRSSFTSIDELEARLREFIAYYNQYLAKPFRWHYDGSLLKVPTVG